MASWVDGKQETMTAKVSQFISGSQKTNQKIAVAINSDAFTLTNSTKSVPTDLCGFGVSNGILVSSGSAGGVAATLFWDPVNGAKMENTSRTSANTSTIAANLVAVSGFSFALQDGVVKVYDATLAARSGAGLSADNRFLFLVTIDQRIGRNASDGATIGQLGEQLLALGSYMGINLDGGGSTQMAWWNPASSSVQVLGGSDTRYVGQHLGVYYLK
jgi:exopolysaccharide biosynthesis protein